MATDTGKIFIGTSGWNYPHWGKGVFYPPELRQKEWLTYYTHYFDTVEVNNTFYQLPHKRIFENWEQSVPPHFSFVVKASRYITHMKKLNQPERPLARFLENVSLLKKKVTLILFQLPPFLKANQLRLKNLIDFFTYQSIIPGVRAAFEFRHRTWLAKETFHLLTKKNVALCFADWPDLTVAEPVTADFIYLRRHGPQNVYASGYSLEEIKRDAHQIRKWVRDGKEVYCYFNNDLEGFAVKNALTLLELVKKK
jgi:uncharacterized protein YecE (DUF72 family)